MFAAWYGGTYFATLGVAWMGLEIAQVDPHVLLRRLSVDSFVDIDRYPPNLINGALALLITGAASLTPPAVNRQT